MSGIIVDPPFFMDQEATRHLLMEAHLSFQGRGSTKLYVLPSPGQILRHAQVITIYHSSDRSPDYVEIDEVDVPKNTPKIRFADIMSRGLFSTLIRTFE